MFSLVAAVLVMMGTASAAGGMVWREDTDEAQALATQARTIAQMQADIKLLEARSAAQADWPAIATAVESSVFTISTDYGLGSGWVVHADATGSDLVTNFHVVEEAVSVGTTTSTSVSSIAR